jgi:outer membrane protein TolC
MRRLPFLFLFILLVALAACSSALTPDSTQTDNAPVTTMPLVKHNAEPNNDTSLTKSPLLLADVINFAIERNPSLKASEARWNAAQTRAVQASASEDPMLSFYRMKEIDDIKSGLVISKKFSTSGRLDLEGKVAEQEALIAQQDFVTQRFMIIAQAKSAYYDFFWVNQAIRINQEIKALISNSEKIAEIQYATGKGSQQDILKARIELARIDNEISIWERVRETALANLNRYLNRPTSALLGEPMDINVKPIKASLEELTQLALEHNPELKAAGLEIEKSKKLTELAGKQYNPDFTLSAEYDRYSYRPDGLPGKNGWAVGIGINLPVWREKYKAAVREAEAQAIASKHNRESAQNNISFALKDIHIRTLNAWRVVELYQNKIIPQSEQLLVSTQASYQTGAANFSEVLDSTRALLDLKLGLYQAQIDYKKALAELESVCAASIEE